MPDSSDRSLNMLAAALQMEQKGREFYGRAADQAENPARSPGLAAAGRIRGKPHQAHR